MRLHFLLAALLVLLPLAGRAAEPAHALTAEDIGAFFDGMMSQRIERDDIAGGAVAVVKDGQLLFEKGYGYADVAARSPVVPDRTLFGIGSVSKLFVGTAVMQLVEAGKLDLDADAAKYLDFPLHLSFPEPVTLRELLSHSAGFEENGKDQDDPPGEPSQLGPFLRTHQPRQIFHPGTRAAYSNYGVSLAGYIVEHVSGQPFAAYVAEHIYQPLGMAHSSFEAPLPADLLPLASKPYWLGSQPPQALEYVGRRPAGGMYATVDDVAHFMLAHLQDGKYGEARILGEAAARTMHTIQWRIQPDVPGMGISFYQVAANGRFALAHGGDITCQHSYLWLIPEQHLGIFVAFNSAGTDWTRLRGAIWESLLDRYFPATAPVLPQDEAAKQAAAAVAGTYVTTRRADTTVLSLTFALSSSAVTAQADGAITIEGLTRYDGTPRKFRPSSPTLFQEEDGSGHTASFVTASDGTRLMVLDSLAEFERESGWPNVRSVQLGLLFGLLCPAILILAWPIGALARRRLGVARVPAAPRLRRDRLVTRVTALGVLALYGLAGLYLNEVAKLRLGVLSSRMDPYLRGFQLLVLCIVVGTVFVLWRVVRAWLQREGRLSDRLGLTLFGLSLLALSAILIGYHMLALDLSF